MGEQTAFFRLLDHPTQVEAAAPLLCVVLDLGDLHRSGRVARMLGRAYTDGLVEAARFQIQDVLGADVPVLAVDTDCFGFVLPDRGNADWEVVLRGLVDRLHLPLDSSGLPGAVDPHIGLVRFRAGNDAPQDILKTAIMAAQDSREIGEAWQLHDIGTEPTQDRMFALVAGLPVALSVADQLSLVYQPRIDLRQGTCRSAEALLRWKHPVLGGIAPGEFIPIAEQTGMARFVTTWVVDRALSDLAAWTRARFSHGVSINISALNLAEENFVGRLDDALRRHAVDPAQVELEFTEGSLISNSVRVRTNIAGLANLGVSLAIDDFGTGYSNLQYLREIPAGTLKIDQSFIRSLATNRRDRAIVRSMIELAHSLGYRVVAEGIEDAGALATLGEWGCDEGQGYHILRPVPLTELQAWLVARRAGNTVAPDAC